MAQHKSELLALCIPVLSKTHFFALNNVLSWIPVIVYESNSMSDLLYCFYIFHISKTKTKILNALLLTVK